MLCSFFEPEALCLSRHRGGGCDLHRQGAAQCHEHLQSKAQGTVMLDSEATTSM